jgi:hypothetical protein
VSQSFTPDDLKFLRAMGISEPSPEETPDIPSAPAQIFKGGISLVDVILEMVRGGLTEYQLRAIENILDEDREGG